MYVLVSDLARWITMSVGFWLSAATAYTTYRRVQLDGWGPGQRPHPATSVGLIILLLVVIGQRFRHLGEGGDVTLWMTFAAVVLLLLGHLMLNTLPNPLTRRR